MEASSFPRSPQAEANPELLIGCAGIANRQVSSMSDMTASSASPHPTPPLCHIFLSKSDVSPRVRHLHRPNDSPQLTTIHRALYPDQPSKTHRVLWMVATSHSISASAAPSPNSEPPPFTESRELGQVDPRSAKDATEITARPASSLKERRPWAHFVAGGLGGMTSATLTSPLDVLKTRLQSDFYQSQLAASRAAKGIPSPSQLGLLRASWLHIAETGQILAQIPRVEGWRALFKGLGPNLIGVVPARAINFWAYGNGKRVYSSLFFDGRETALVHLLSAATAGIITGTATNPIWLVKTRLQLDKQHAGPGGQGRMYRNAWDCVRQTMRTEGIRGLYRGLSASYLGVSESTLQWVLYEQAKRSLSKRERDLALSGRQATMWDQTVEWSGKLIAAGGAKFIAALITYPHEVVRTRLRQAPVDAAGNVKYKGLWSCFVTIFREEGMPALYGGLVPHMLRVVPSAAIMFGVYEGVLRGLGESAQV